MSPENHDMTSSKHGIMGAGLEGLRWGRNGITSFPAAVLASLQRLTALDLSGNHLSVLFTEDSQLEGAASAESVAGAIKSSPMPDLDWHPFSCHAQTRHQHDAPRHIPGAGHLPRLQVLDLSSNYFAHIPSCLPSSLRALYMSTNLLREVPRWLASRAPNLSHLDVHMNDIRIVHADVLCLTSLTLLALAQNPVQEMQENTNRDSHVAVTASEGMEQGQAAHCKHAMTGSLFKHTSSSEP
jgi:Leucine-rich repeat (LRR) protein